MPEKKTGKQVAAGETWVAVRVPIGAKERLDKWAKRKDVSSSWIMRRLLLDALDAGRDEGDNV